MERGDGMSVFDRPFFVDRASIVPGAVTITYTSQGSTDGADEVIAIAGARKRPVTRQSQFFGSMLLTSDSCEWIIPRVACCLETEPKERDEIDDGTRVWIVDQVTTGLMESEFRCLCQPKK
jgi:hypothetical protein